MDVDRFWTRVEAEGDCLVWTGTTDRRGYGAFYARGRQHRAYRWLYEYLMGPVPEGLELDHLCRNPACVNVLHLEPVTHAENHARRPDAIRPTCGKGHLLEGGNLKVRVGRGGRQWRVCRECHRANDRAYYARKTA